MGEPGAKRKTKWYKPRSVLQIAKHKLIKCTRESEIYTLIFNDNKENFSYNNSIVVGFFLLSLSFSLSFCFFQNRFSLYNSLAVLELAL